MTNETRDEQGQRQEQSHPQQLDSGQKLSEPEPPDSLPKYIAEGVPKQDLNTLRDLHGYVAALIAYKEQPAADDDLPDDGETVEENNTGRGTVVKETVTCGDESCHCMSGGEEHGPYLYRYYYDDGSLTSEYIRKPGE